MKKITLPAVLGVVLLAIGCSQNTIEIQNEAEGGVWFLFRGETYRVGPDSSATIGLDEPIPNGSFHYSTTYDFPSGYSKSVADPDLAGTLEFLRNQTSQVLIYSSSWSMDSINLIYEIHLNRSSNDPVSGL